MGCRFCRYRQRPACNVPCRYARAFIIDQVAGIREVMQQNAPATWCSCGMGEPLSQHPKSSCLRPINLPLQRPGMAPGARSP